jgi:hypothetical protein
MQTTHSYAYRRTDVFIIDYHDLISKFKDQNLPARNAKCKQGTFIDFAV